MATVSLRAIVLGAALQLLAGQNIRKPAQRDYVEADVGEADFAGGVARLLENRGKQQPSAQEVFSRADKLCVSLDRRPDRFK